MNAQVVEHWVRNEALREVVRSAAHQVVKRLWSGIKDLIALPSFLQALIEDQFAGIGRVAVGCIFVAAIGAILVFASRHQVGKA
ncbi:MAG TPA: hypothetical protein VN785_00670 [Candidatus Angelobacter sp.]|nr:hypothetical protein [Candidatus Angelobacter sp.]